MKPDIIEVKEKVKKYILQTISAESEKIKNETLIFKEGYFDSMGFVLLITFLEEEFGIKAGDSDLVEDNFESIDAIADFVNRKAK